MFMEIANLNVVALFERRSGKDLFGCHLDVDSGEWVSLFFRCLVWFCLWIRAWCGDSLQEFHEKLQSH